RAAEACRAAEVHDAGDPHGDGRPACLDADRLPDLQVLLVHRRLVDHDLVRPRPVPVDELERVELGPTGIDAEAEVRGTAEGDDLAVDDEVREAADAADRVRYVRQVADLRQQRLGEGRGRRVVVVAQV